MTAHRKIENSVLPHGGGQTGELFRSVDWSQNPLGPCEQWPTSLKALLRTLFNCRQPMFLWWGPELIQFYNDGYLPSFGVGKHPRAMGQRGEECWPEIWPIIKPQIDSVLNEGKSTWDQNRLIPFFRNGKVEDIFWTYGYSPIYDDAFKISGVFCVCTETTNEVLAARALKESKEIESQSAKLEAMFSESPVGICLLRGESLVCEKVNDNFRRLVGPREYIGRTYDEIYPELKDSGQQEIIRTVLRTGKPFQAIESKIRVVFDKGQLQDRYYNFTYNRILASDGIPYGIFCQCTDVTESVTDRIKLAASEQSLQLALAGGHMGTWSVDLSTNMISFDDRARDLNGLAEGDRADDAIEHLSHEDDRAHIREALKNAITTRTPYECEYRIKQPDGIYRWVYARGEPKIGADGSVESISGVTFDISEKKAAALELLAAKEVADRANQTKSSFLANMSHEIRTPLGAILGFTDLLKQGSLDTAERQQFLDTISRNGKALTRIIDDILDLAKVESGKLEIERIEFSYLDIIDDVMDLFRERTRAKGIFLRSQASGHMPTRIVSDPTRLRQILINIVGNAVKFTDSGGVTLEVAAAAVDGGNDTEFQIHVCDSGIGISEEELARLFQPFVQADNSTSRKFGGTGLGLVLSKRLAGALGGDVRVRTNSPNPGCTFTVSFIARVSKKSAAEAAVPAKPKHGSESVNVLDGIRVLLAEDSKDNQFLVVRMLKRFGAVVETADDGVHAFRAGVNGDFDIVLMDIQMPGMDGYEATSSLRNAGFKKPIIALTAHAMAEERARTRAAGCDEHLTKPLNQDELVDAILRLTAIRQISVHPGGH
jgi:PAS domain S-box-containing protein